MNRLVLILLAALGIASMFLARSVPAQTETHDQRRAINLPGKPIQAPVSNAILAGNTLYTGGNIGFDPKTGEPPAQIDDEIKLLLDGIKPVLAQANMTMDDIVYVEVFCTDLSYYDKFNAIYKTYFSKDFPARAFIGTSSLIRHAHLEMHAIAVHR